jgi:hypothetical protein
MVTISVGSSCGDISLVPVFLVVVGDNILESKTATVTDACAEEVTETATQELGGHAGHAEDG